MNTYTVILLLPDHAREGRDETLSVVALGDDLPAAVKVAQQEAANIIVPSDPVPDDFKPVAIFRGAQPNLLRNGGGMSRAEGEKVKEALTLQKVKEALESVDYISIYSVDDNNQRIFTAKEKCKHALAAIAPHGL